MKAPFSILLLLALSVTAGEPQLNIEKRSADVVVFVTGGDTNKQYWVLTSNDYTVTTTNWYEWRRFYPGTNNAVPVFVSTAPTNTAASKPMRFFKLGGET